MSNSLAHRDPATLAPADFNDRRRLAMAELAMIAEEGSWSPLVQGQVLLKHVVATPEVASMGDAIVRVLNRGR